MTHHKGYIKDNENFRKLYENTSMVLGHFFETAYIINKIIKEEIPIFEFNNDFSTSLNYTFILLCSSF